MDVIIERPGALDVHNASVMACVRLPSQRGRREEHVEEFPTTTQGLLTLRDWLGAHGVTHVVMEATGAYWKPVWAILEDDFGCLLVNARHVKQVPGRKTDVKDAQWLCQLLEAGLLKASLVPPRPIRTLRNLTRYRKSQIRDRQREANRLHKVMQDTGIKLDCVASDLLGKSGRAMLDALVAGTTDPAVLADLARGQLRKKLPALQEALEGRFGIEHRLVVGRILAHIDFLDESIEQLSAAIEEQIAPFAPAVELLCTIPGVQRRTAQVIIAEMRQRVFGRVFENIDPKGEYGPLVEAMGGQVLRLEPGGAMRLNPLTRIGSRELREGLLEAVTRAMLDRPLSQAEHVGLASALQAADRVAGDGEVCIPDVLEQLRNPARELSDELMLRGVDAAREELRECALALKRLCRGPLAGMFDGPPARVSASGTLRRSRWTSPRCAPGCPAATWRWGS